MSQKPQPVLVANSITSPSKTPSAADTPSGLGAYGQVARPRFMSQRQQKAYTPSKSPGPKASDFRYRPSRPSLGYIFDKPPSIAIGSPQPHNGANNTSDSKKKKSKKKDKKTKKKDKKTKLDNEQAKQRMESIRRDRKQSTLSEFSTTPQGQAMDAIKRELEFLKQEVPSFQEKFGQALTSFKSTSHNKSTQIQYAFIQALSSWVLEEGAPAVKELAEFKQDVQYEMTNLITQLEDVTKQNTQLTVVISDLQQQNDEISKAYSETNVELTKVQTVIKEKEEEEETTTLVQNDIKDLSKELAESEENRRVLKEKNQRLEGYLKMTQKENDELANKSYGLEDELTNYQTEIAKMRSKINALERQHEHELRLLAQTHEEYKDQMETEQEQLVSIAEEAQQQIQQMTQLSGKPQPILETPILNMADSGGAPRSVLPTTEDGLTLDAEFNQYYSDDEWLQDSEEEPEPEPEPQILLLDSEILESNIIEIAPISPDSTWQHSKISHGEDPIDVTQSFKHEKQKTIVDPEDITKEFGHERTSTGVELEDITTKFGSEKQSYGVEIEDASSKFGSEKISTGVEIEDVTNKFGSEKQSYGVEIEDVTNTFGSEKISTGIEIEDVTNTFEMVKETTNNTIEEKDLTMEFETVKEINNVDSIDTSKEWKSSRQSFSENKKDPTIDFINEIQKYGEDKIDITKHFRSESLMNELERADISNTFVMETKKFIKDEIKEPSPEPIQFESETMKIIVDKPKVETPKQESPTMELAFSKTDLSYTPKTSDVDGQFESAAMSLNHEAEKKKKPQYAYQVRHLRMAEEDEAPVRVTKIRKPPPSPHDRPNFGKYYDGKDEIIRKSLAFQKIMSKWKKDDDEKGGKPSILMTQEHKLANKWDNVPKNNLRSPKESIGFGSFSDNSPIFGAQHITKTKHHTLKPKLMGFMTIIYADFVPKYQLKKEPKWYFCLDGLPSTTNLDKNEPEFVKERKNDFLVPALFAFDKKEDYKQLAREAGALPVRNAKFQTAFARRVKGLITLHTHSVDTDLNVAISKLEVIKEHTINFAARNEDTKEKSDKSLYVVSETSFYRFEFDDEDTRDKWLSKINKLVMKRSGSVARASHQYRVHKQSLGVGVPVQRTSRASSRMSEIKEVEMSFD